jgi:hypothetical protein
MSDKQIDDDDLHERLRAYVVSTRDENGRQATTIDMTLLLCDAIAVLKFCRVGKAQAVEKLVEFWDHVEVQRNPETVQ